ncbi:MAG: methyltransferase domain-containing protein [Anaerolineales bacterium]|nr:methyltransferase domain-containing protein [Anaerolineales bacterium]
MDSLSEVEVQALIAHAELVDPVETPNNNHYSFYPQTLEDAGAYFRCFRVDWSSAYPALVARGLMVATPERVALTESGLAAARTVRAQRPPIWYFYKEYYTAGPKSAAFARYCEEVFGKHLHQANFSDMPQLDFLLEVAALDATMRVLDLGCGVGMIAEYISDVTGAHVWGMDYMPEAIAAAQVRTTAKRDRLAFDVGNLDALPYPDGAFDAILSVDTLYMPRNLDDTLRRIYRMLAPGGQFFVFWMEMVWDPDASRTMLEPNQTTLATALTRVGLTFRAWDFSAGTWGLMQRKRVVAERMRAEFEAEGNGFIYENLMAESIADSGEYDSTSCNFRRYLYQVRV